MKTSLVYLASPYSHPDPRVREGRFQSVCQAAAHLMKEGIHVFSPIAHTHPISLAGKLPGDWEYWRAYDEVVLSACGALVVLKLDKWEESKGIQGEVGIAERLLLPTHYVDPYPECLDLLARVVKDTLKPSPSTQLPGR
jgi:hypothetical protein